MKLGTLFDGIGGFPLSAVLHGIEPVWASEIEKFPIEVTKARFPNMKHLGDITQINGAEIEPVDIISAGSPCQDLSVAGKREGLAGKRSGLFMEFIRIVREMRNATANVYPRFVIWENVPGAFSSNGGQDIQAVLDLLQDSGYVLDMNVLDAQYMGVPQRRKRVFIVCVNVNFILQQTTALSGNTITQCLTKILQDTLGAHLKASGTEGLNSDWLDHLKDGLHRKMNLFEITSAENLLTLHQGWEEIIRKQGIEQGNSDCNSTGLTTTNILEGILSSENQARTAEESLSLNTLKLWKKFWEEALWVKNLSTTSTATSEITNRGIYTCALINLNMARRIVPLKNYCPKLSETALSILTVMKECISYAKQASGNLFEPMEWVERWHDYISAASDCREQIERHLAGRSGQEVFPISESVSGNLAESRKAREEVAAGARDGVEGAISFDNQTGDSIGFDVTPSIRSNSHGSLPCIAKAFRMVAFGEYADDDTASAMKARDYKDATDLVAVEKLYDMTHADEVIRECEPGVSPTLNARMGTGGNQIPIRLHKSFTPSQFGQYQEGCGTLRANGGDLGGGSENLVSNNYTVRRLTPTECERLQGFPDNWTSIPGASDTGRKKALGNSVAAPCVAWIMARIKGVVT